MWIHHAVEVEKRIRDTVRFAKLGLTWRSGDRCHGQKLLQGRVPHRSSDVYQKAWPTIGRHSCPPLLCQLSGTVTGRERARRERARQDNLTKNSK